MASKGVHSQVRNLSCVRLFLPRYVLSSPLPETCVLSPSSVSVYSWTNVPASYGHRASVECMRKKGTQEHTLASTG
jgi:hypothetical protein